MIPNTLAEDRHMVLKNLLKNNNGTTLENDFKVTMSLYTSQENTDPV